MLEPVDFDPYSPCIYIKGKPIPMGRDPDGMWVPTGTPVSMINRPIRDVTSYKEKLIRRKRTRGPQEIRWKNGDRVDIRKLLGTLNPSPQCVTEIVRRTGLSQRNVARLLGLLQLQGKVVTRPSPVHLGKGRYRNLYGLPDGNF